MKQLCWLLLASSVLLARTGQPFGMLTRNRLLSTSLQWTTINVFFSGVLLLFLVAGSGAAKRFVDIPALRFLGYISYGLYLDHLLAFRMYDRVLRHYWPGLMPSNGHFELVLLRYAVGGGAAIGVAYLSRRFYEERFLRLKDSLVPDLSNGNETAIPVGDTQAA